MRTSLRAILNRFRFQKIRNRFLFVMILLSIPPLFILGYIAIDIARGTIMEINTSTNQDHLETSSEVADLLFRNAVNLNRSIILNDEIRDALRDATSSDQADPLDTRHRIVNQLQSIMNSSFLNYRLVDSVCLMDLNYETYCLGRSDNAGIYEGAGKPVRIQQSPWYHSAFDAKGRVLFFSENVLGDSDNTFSTVKLFRDSDDIKGEPIGILIVNISRSIFESIFTGNKKYGGEFIALDASADPVQVIYAQKQSEARRFVQGSAQDTYRTWEEHDYLIVEYKNETTGWQFVHLIKLSELLKQSNKIGTVTTVIAVLIALVALLLSLLISGSITKPLLRLKKMMVDWTKGKRTFSETFGQDEVGAIGETFKRVVTENVQLSEKLVHTQLKEREAELRALQAQIKPHFLYNTLDSIYWMAILQKNNDIAQMAVSLSESFKLSLNKGKETIPLYKELKHIEHYLTIQNIRYNNRFQYEEQVDESIKGMEILKLLLQPLVENAIYHGLEPKIGEGKITLSGMMDRDELVFIVEDNGIGIADMEETEQGYGLRNVKERLRMYYGTASSLTIASKMNEGTRLELRFKPQDIEVRLDA